MKIHEYQAKAILAQSGIPVPRGRVVDSPDQARDAATELGGKAVLKAQVHAGGRGKAGGIKVVQDAREAEQLAKQMLGSYLISHQTSGEGFKVITLVLIAFGVFTVIAGFMSGEATRVWANLLLNNYYFLSVTIGATFWMALQAITQSGWSAAYGVRG